LRLDPQGVAPPHYLRGRCRESRISSHATSWVPKKKRIFGLKAGSCSRGSSLYVLQKSRKYSIWYSTLRNECVLLLVVRIGSNASQGPSPSVLSGRVALTTLQEHVTICSIVKVRLRTLVRSMWRNPERTPGRCAT
jgi:hypothetical protein